MNWQKCIYHPTTLKVYSCPDIGEASRKDGRWWCADVKLPLASGDLYVPRDEAANPGEVSDKVGGDDPLQNGVDDLQERES